MSRKRRKSPAVNRSLPWVCPYFKWDGLQEINCEGGRIRLPDKDAAVAFMRKHCAAAWEQCSVAHAINEYYDRRTENNGTEKD